LDEVFVKVNGKLCYLWHRLFRISAANIGPNRFHQNLPVMADLDPALRQQILDVAQRQWTFTHIITTRRITSGALVKYRNGLLIRRG
jgi:hypothetical protein